MSPVSRVALIATTAAVTLAAAGILVLVGAFEGDGGDGPAVPGGPRAAAQDGDEITRIYRDARDRVLLIQARIVQEQRSPFGPPRRRQGVATGTGFVYDEDGSVVTNAHVVENAEDVVIRVDENTLVSAEVVGSDLGTDLALLRVDQQEIEAPPLPLGDSAAVQVGEPVLAMGHPLGLEDTITAGIVSAKHRSIMAPSRLTIENVIQTDAAVNPGNSGGPLLDIEGRVIGVNSQIATSGPGRTGFIGIAFAVPVNTVKQIVPELADDGEVERPTLGVTAVTVTPALAAQLELSVERGALVVGVRAGSAAAAAGLRGAGTPGGGITREGDVIVRLGDREIDSVGDLRNAVADIEAGTTVPIEFVRDGQRRTIRVRL